MSFFNFALDTFAFTRRTKSDVCNQDDCEMNDVKALSFIDEMKFTNKLV